MFQEGQDDYPEYCDTDDDCITNTGCRKNTLGEIITSNKLLYRIPFLHNNFKYNVPLYPSYIIYIFWYK